MKRATSRSDTRRNHLIWGLSLIVAASMVCSLAVSLLPERNTPAQAAPTAEPLWTPSPIPPTAMPEPSATPTAAPASTTTPIPREESGLTWTFAVLGSSWGLDEAARSALAAIREEGDLFVLHTGSMTVSGTAPEFLAWQEHCRALGVTLYPVPGNRDNADGLLVAYSATSGAPASHYAIDRGALHIAVLNASLGSLSEGELAWLRQDLAVTPRSLRAVALHYPPVDPSGQSEALTAGADELVAIAAEQGVDLVVSGHGLDMVDTTIDGVRYVTVGALSSAPDSEQPSTPAYLRVTVDGDNFTLETVPATVRAPMP